MPAHLEALARIRTYRDLLSVLAARRDEMNVALTTLDAAARLTNGHSQKLLTWVKDFGSKSFDAMLEQLKVDVLVVPRCSAAEAFSALRPAVRRERIKSQVRRRKRGKRPSPQSCQAPTRL